MKTLTQILLVFLLLSPQSIAAKENYLEYHQKIIACERLFLFDNNVPAALAGYRKVISEYKKPFVKDCFVALQLACNAYNTEMAEYFFKRAFERGLEIEAVQSSKPVTRYLSAHPEMAIKASKLYKSGRESFMRSINKELRAEIIRMKNLDDSFKARYDGQPREVYNRLKPEHRTVIDSNTLNLVRLTRKHGFPGDNLVGLMDYGFGGDKEQRRLHRFQLRSLVDQLFFHHGCAYFMLEKELEAALTAGEIQPGMYAMIYEWAYKDLQEGRQELALCSTAGKAQTKHYNICPVIPQWNKHKDTAFVNKCRAEIGMTSVEHLEKKQAFEKETGIKLLFGMFNLY